MTGKSFEKNVKVKLGLLEAKAGKDTSISWCKAAVNSRKASHNVKSLLESSADTEAAITELRRQKVESKFYHVKSKLLPKQMKKVKVFLTQRVVKKIKQRKEENGDVKDLEVELGRVKALDHLKLSQWTFTAQILKDDYVQAKLKDLGIVCDAVNFEFEGLDKILSIKCYQDAVKSCRSELVLFIQKLLHEVKPEPVAREARKQNVNEKRFKPLSADKSFFMESLNASDSENDVSVNGEGSDAGNFEGRVAFTDDEDDGGYSADEYEDSEEELEQKPKKKKNRLGQMARRRLAEKMFGRDAKHIKNGGMTVQQREELRKQKSQQRKERAARIKKDAAKNAQALKEKASNESVSEFKKAASIKIDPKMHPSWAAKLQQQAKAQQTSFQGQKIKFED